jgi:hypothetical protein
MHLRHPQPLISVPDSHPNCFMSICQVFVYDLSQSINKPDMPLLDVAVTPGLVFGTIGLVIAFFVLRFSYDLYQVRVTVRKAMRECGVVREFFLCYLGTCAFRILYRGI